jgi:hypothetical protein
VNVCDANCRAPRRGRCRHCHEFGPVLLDLVLDQRRGRCSGCWQEWCRRRLDDTDASSPLLYGDWGRLAAILVLDQFSRHVHRWLQATCCINESATTTTTPSTTSSTATNALFHQLDQRLPNQATLDALAYQTARLVPPSLEARQMTDFAIQLKDRIHFDVVVPDQCEATQLIATTLARLQSVASDNDGQESNPPPTTTPTVPITPKG